MDYVIEHFREVLLETVPLMEGAQALLRQDDESWIIAFNDEAVLELHVDDRLHKLVLSMALGATKEHQRATTYHALLV
ncbi:MAG: hypothetical protein V2J55_17050, partial [Candidatus Competibacteraceae bacterium]|nr:hypothetical protein [Candidatus Competibacteraceae bacterium]